MIAYFRKVYKSNIKIKLMRYGKKLDSLTIFIKIIIKPNNKVYKLVIEIYYNKANNKVRSYFRYTSYYNK